MPTANSTESDNGESGQRDNGDSVTQSNDESITENNTDSGKRGFPDNSQRAGGATGNPGTPNFGEVLASIQAMPEQIVRALKEATAAPTQPRKSSPDASASTTGSGSQTAAQTASRTTNADKPSEPGRKSFAQWWFGS